MSDSEEEAFQSADEGEGTATAVDTTKGPPGQMLTSSENEARGKKKQNKRQRKKKAKAQTSNESTSSKEVESCGKEEQKTQEEVECKQLEVGAESGKGDTEEQKPEPGATQGKAEEKSNIEEIQTEGKDDVGGKAEVAEEMTGDEDKSGDVIAAQPSGQPPVQVSSPEKPTEQQQSILDKLSDVAAKPGGSNWGGWGSWGSSLLSTATSSVSTFKQQVGEGLNTVLETVESTLGAPDPEELAQQDRVARGAKEPDETPNGRSECNQEEPADTGEDQEEDGATGGQGKTGGGWAPWSGWGLSEVTKVVGETGKTLVSGGLDVLESIGKTTYNVIAEGDHGLKNTIRQTGQKPNLSQILRDAKEEHDQKAKLMGEYEEARKANFGALFDDNNGLVHLEALELVSTQCDSKVQSLLGTMSHSDLNALKRDLIAIKDKFEIDEDEESDDEEEAEAGEDHTFSEQCKEIMRELGLPLTSDRLAQAFNRCRAWLKDCQEEQEQGVKISSKEVHRMGIQSLAELTANSVQQFHKVAQLLQMTASGPLSIHVNRADCLSRLTKLLCREVSYISVKFTACLNAFCKDNDEMSREINPLITNIYLEASNSKTYVQDAFRLLLPVVQHTALLAYSREKQNEQDSS